MAIVLSLLAVVLPGAAAWIWGRIVLASIDKTDLAERLAHGLRRLSLVWTSCAAVLLFSDVPLSGLWIAASFVSFLIGWFPVRRTTRGETWSVGGYLLFELRLVVGVFAFYLLVAGAPWIVQAVPPAGRVATAVAVGAILLAWRHFFSHVLLFAFGARPLARPDLDRRFAEVAARAGMRAPTVFTAGPRGGIVANHVALAGVHAIFLSSTLVERLSADELAALYASNLAFIEAWPARRRRVFRLCVGAIILVGVGVMPWVGMQSIGALGWLLVVACAYLENLRREALRQTARDQRAAAISDGESLIAALIKVHALSQQPRRATAQQEEVAPGMSLAKRIQMIRLVASPGAPYRSNTAPDTPWPMVIASRDPGRWIVLDGDRGHWLDGVPEGCEPEAPILRGHARSVRTLAYSELTTLCVQGAGESSTVEAVDKQGQRWSTPIRGEQAATVRAALLRVEGRLAPRGSTSRPTITTRLLRLPAVVVAVSVMSLPAMAMGIISIFRPSPLPLAAFGGALLAVGLQWDSSTKLQAHFSEGRWLALLCGAAFLAIAASQAKTAPQSRSHARVAVWATLASVLSVLSIGAVLAVATRPGALGLHHVTRSLPGIGAGLLALAAALAMVGTRGARVAATVCVAAFGLFAAVHSSLFVERFVHDPLLVAGPAVTPARGALVPVTERPLGGPVSMLRLSPDGSAFAAARSLSTYEEDDEPRAIGARFEVGPFEGMTHPLDADDWTFVDGKRGLALSPREGTLELRLVAVDDPSRMERSWLLPALQRAEVTTDGTTWRVSGHNYGRREQVTVTGRLDSAETKVETQPGVLHTLVVGIDQKLLVRNHYDASVASIFALPFFPGAMPGRRDLVLQSHDGEVVLVAKSILSPDCHALADGFVCLTSFEDRQQITRTARGTLQPVLSLNEPYVHFVAATGGDRVVLRALDGAPVVVDVARRQATRYELPSGRECQVITAVGPFIGATCGAQRSGRLLRVFRTTP